MLGDEVVGGRGEVDEEWGDGDPVRRGGAGGGVRGGEGVADDGALRGKGRGRVKT